MTKGLPFIVFVATACQVPQSETHDRRDYSGALADTQSWIQVSEITGRTYEISVALPRDYAGSESTYPVLYAVDANGQFGTVVEASRNLSRSGEIPDLIVVGVGYPVGRFIRDGPRPHRPPLLVRGPT